MEQPLESKPVSKRGGARPGSGRKAGAVKAKPKRVLPKPSKKAKPHVAISDDVVKEGKRMALNMQRTVQTELLHQAGIAPLDILHHGMLRLAEKAGQARDAGGVLTTIKHPEPVMMPDGSPAMKYDLTTGKMEPVFTDAKWFHDSETTLLTAMVDAANKAAAYVHPKLASIDLTAKTETFEEWAAKMAAKHNNLAPGGEVREVEKV